MMLATMNGICSVHTYYPVVTEVQGVILIAAGITSLGIAGVLKVGDYYTGRKAIVPYISGDAARLQANIGTGLLKQGLKQILPATSLILAIYAWRNRYERLPLSSESM